MLGISIHPSPVPNCGCIVTSFLVVLLLSLPYHDGWYPSTEPKNALPQLTLAKSLIRDLYPLYYLMYHLSFLLK